MRKRVGINEQSIAQDMESQSDSNQVSDLEKLREDNIKRNEAFLMSLGLPVVSTPSEKRQPTNRRSSKPVVKKEPEVSSVRRSARVTIEKLKEEISGLKQKEGDDSNESLRKDAEDKLALMTSQSYVSEYSLSLEEAQGEADDQRLGPGPVTMLPPWNANKIDEEDRSIWEQEIFRLGETFVAESMGRKEKSVRALLIQSPSKSKRSAESSQQNYSDTSANMHELVSTEESMSKINKFNVRENEVTKLTEARITCTYFLPTAHKLVCCAGDKIGVLGIWDVDKSDSPGGGVYKYRPYRRNVIQFHSTSSDVMKLYSASYDGTIRMMDLAQQAFVLAFEDTVDDRSYFSDVDFNSNGDGALIGRSDGSVGYVDFRVPSTSGSYAWLHTVHGSKINSIQSHPTNDNYIVTASSSLDGCIMIHDKRIMPANKGNISSSSSSSSSSSRSGTRWSPTVTLDLHSKSINCATVSPDGQYLVSVSLDNTIKCSTNFLNTSVETTSQPSKKSRTMAMDTPLPVLSSPLKTTTLRHDNHTGRWLSTFRPAFDPKQGHCFSLGSMAQPRGIEVFVPTADHIKLECILRSDWLGSVCSRNCFHPYVPAILGGNSSGRVHLFR